MKTVIQTWQPAIQQEIIDILTDFSAENARFSLDSEHLEYLKELSIKGKQFRGCLLAGFYSLVHSEMTEAEKRAIILLAAAIELHGTAILIHDDIIDKSDTRRGMTAVHVFAKELAEKNNLSDATHFGVGVAICLADVLFFLADKTVAELDLPAEIKMKIAAINGEELALLGLAEIEDMRLSSSSASFSKEDVLQMFAGKTGRYTGRWPLHLAAVVAGLPVEAVKEIAKIGEKIGSLYQLKDDELGIFGDNTITGKSTTSDLTEGKKTFYYWYLQQLPSAEKEKVFSIIGNGSATVEQLNEVKHLIEEKGIRQKVAEEIDALKKSVSAEVAALNIPEPACQFLQEVVEFVVQRNK